MFEIWTDGACRANGKGGPGGWGVVVIENSTRATNARRELSGFIPSATNNIAELTAAIEGLKAVPEGSQAMVYTDSQYVVRGITEWIHGWLENHWQTKEKKPVKNQALWEALHRLNRARVAKWKWVPGHSGVGENDHCDLLACTAIRDGLREQKARVATLIDPMMLTQTGVMGMCAPRGDGALEAFDRAFEQHLDEI